MEALLATMFAAGLASGLHCVAMCGGIVAAFDAKRIIPIRNEVVWSARIAFNLGRISTYSVAGATAGAFGAAACSASIGEKRNQAGRAPS